MAVQFKIMKGLSANLPQAQKEEGCWYLTTDTQELYVCLNNTLHKVSAMGSFDPKRVDALEGKVKGLESQIKEASSTKSYPSFSDLPKEGAENIIYIVEDENAVYRYFNLNGESHYYCVGRDYENIAVIVGGDSSD